LVRWPSVDIQVKFYGDSPRGTLPYADLNTRGVAKYSELSIGTNSVTLDDLEQCNSPNRHITSLNLVAFGADYETMVKDTSILKMEM